MLNFIQNQAAWLTAVCAAIAALVAIGAKVRKRAKAALSKLNGALETLVGREEIRHPDTGHVLAEATPALGARFARLEDAVVHLADTNQALTALDGRVTELDGRLTTHIAACPPGVVINTGPQGAKP